MAGFSDFQQSGVAGTSSIDDNTDPSVLIESADGADYIEIDTTDSAEKLILAGGGASVISVGDVEIENASPTLTFDNSTAEDSDNGRESQMDFTGLRTGGGSPAAVTMARVQVSHDGSADDSKGKIVFQANDGSSLTEYLRIHSAGQISTGGETAVMDVAPKGSLHIMTGNSTVTDVTANADDLIVEGSGNTGISICTTSSYEASLNFVDPATNDVGLIGYHHNTDKMRFKTAGGDRLTIDGSGNVGINESSPAYKFHVKASSTHEDLIGFKTDTDHLAIRMETYDSAAGAISLYGTNAAGAKVKNQHRLSARAGSDGFVLFNEQQHDCNFNYSSANVANMLHCDASADKIGINTNAPAAILDVKGTLNEALTGHLDSSSSGTSLVGDGTDFKNELNWGSAIKITTDGGTETFTVASIQSDTALTLDSAISGTPTDNSTMYTDPPAFRFQTGDGKDLFKRINDQQFHLGADDDTGLKLGNSLFSNDDNSQTENTGFGTKLGLHTTGNSNVLFGQSVMHNTGASSSNVCFGRMIMTSGSAASNNTIMGSAAGTEISGGDDNTIMGYRAGNTITSGNQNISIGSESDCAATLDNQIAIGYNVVTSAANSAVIGNNLVESLSTAGDGVCALGTESNGFKELNLKTAFASGTSGTFGSKGIDIRKADDTISFEVLGAGGVRATFDDTNGLTQSSGELIMVCHTGDCNEHQLTADITTMKIHFYPAQGTYQTRTCILQQRDTSGGAAYTITYPSTAAAFTGYGTGSLGNVTIKWAGGVKHTMSTGDQAFDIVQFVLTHDTSGNEMIYASVIGQAYA